MISWLSYGHHIAGVLSRLRCKYMYVYKYMFFDSDYPESLHRTVSASLKRYVTPQSRSRRLRCCRTTQRT